MKKLTIREILITIIASYLVVSYVNAQFNPLNLSLGARLTQIFLLGLSLFAQLLIKNK